MNHLKLSFTITFYFLIFACFVYILLLFLTKSKKLHDILYIETTITTFAIIVYFFYLNYTEKYLLTYKYRYIILALTTSLMFISLTLLLYISTNMRINPLFILSILFLDWIMLFLEFLGDHNKISRLYAGILGFLLLAIIFYLIYTRFIKHKNNFMNKFLFGLNIVIWTIYNILYIMDQTMNTTFNILDCIAKAFVCIYICIYIWRHRE